jgi:molybdopterin-guanine dinucleotide biosynthesis protein A
MNQHSEISPRGFVIAGGKSSRMGANKAFLDFHRQTLLSRALAALTEACGNATIVGDPQTFANLGPVVADVFSGCGPLAGIHAALLHSSADLNLMLAVDMPFVSPELLKFLLREAEITDAIVTVPRTGRGLQPLCAVYRREFVSTAEQALRAGSYKIDATFAHVPLRVVDEPELVVAGFSAKSFFNVNTPEDRHTADDLSSLP